MHGGGGRSRERRAWNNGWVAAEANGEGLKNALMWFNDRHLVVSNANRMGWDADGVGGSTTVIAVGENSLDAFWGTLHTVDLSPTVDLTGIS